MWDLHRIPNDWISWVPGPKTHEKSRTGLDFDVENAVLLSRTWQELREQRNRMGRKPKSINWSRISPAYEADVNWVAGVCGFDSLRDLHYRWVAPIASEKLDVRSAFPRLEGHLGAYLFGKVNGRQKASEALSVGSNPASRAILKNIWWFFTPCLA